MPAPDMVSAKGVWFYFHEGASWPKEQVDEQEEWFVSTLHPRSNGYYRWDVEKQMGKVYVDLYPDKIVCGALSPSGFCAGLQYDQNLQLWQMDCVYTSAYTHELMHWLQQSIKGYVDYDHGEQNIWPIADGAPHGCY